jgi:hypothetical protein
MESLSLVLTCASLAVAVGCGWYAWRLRRDERERSEARVAALSSAIDAMDSASSPGRPAPTRVAVNGLFAPEHSAAAHGTPVIKLAAGVAMGLLIVVVVAMSTRGKSADTTSTDSPRAVATRSGAPLELISMRYEREGETFKVSGLVRNPRNGARVARVTAVVFAFNRAGAFVTSGRAALDFTTLEPGDESPFVVTIPGLTDVARYRVSFRTEAGVIQHVDRRAEQMRLALAGS